MRGVVTEPIGPRAGGLREDQPASESRGVVKVRHGVAAPRAVFSPLFGELDAVVHKIELRPQKKPLSRFYCRECFEELQLRSLLPSHSSLPTRFQSSVKPQRRLALPSAPVPTQRSP